MGATGSREGGGFSPREQGEQEMPTANGASDKQQRLTASTSHALYDPLEMTIDLTTELYNLPDWFQKL